MDSLGNVSDVRWMKRAVLGCLVLFSCYGCSPSGHGFDGFEEFVPVALEIGGDLPPFYRPEPFSFHPEYYEDPNFSVGLILELQHYGHDFIWMKDRVLVRKSMLRSLNSTKYKNAPREDELDYRANLTDKAFYFGRVYHQGLAKDEE